MSTATREREKAEGCTCSDEETPCPKRKDNSHCDCWWDGEKCCACGDGQPPCPLHPLDDSTPAKDPA